MAPPPRPPYNIGVQFTYRDRLPTAIYKDNYGYAINYYQPMIDYLDNKRRSATPQPLPHLPLEDERCLTRYSVRKSIPTYSESDLSVLSKEAQDTAKKQLLDFRSDYPRSHFSVIKTADAVRLAKHLKSDTVEDRQLQRDIENRRIARQIEREEHYKMMRSLNRYDNDRDAMMSKSLKTAIKGKSALQIRDILLADAQKNLRQSEVNEVSYKQQIQTACKSGRAMSECRCSNLEWEDDVRLEKCMEDKQMSHSLDVVKRDLRSFTTKTEEFLHDARLKAYYYNLNLAKKNQRKISTVVKTYSD
jgi:hypothetical protein